MTVWSGFLSTFLNYAKIATEGTHLPVFLPQQISYSISIVKRWSFFLLF